MIKEKTANWYTLRGNCESREKRITKRANMNKMGEEESKNKEEKQTKNKEKGVKI